MDGLRFSQSMVIAGTPRVMQEWVREFCGVCRKSLRGRPPNLTADLKAGSGLPIYTGIFSGERDRIGRLWLCTISKRCSSITKKERVATTVTTLPTAKRYFSSATSLGVVGRPRTH